MKAKFYIFIPLLLLLFVQGHGRASGVVASSSLRSYSSVLHKTFILDAYPYNQEEEHWILVQTNPHEAEKNFNHLEYHQKFLRFFMDAGWQPYLFPKHSDEYPGYFDLEEIDIGNGVLAYKPLSDRGNLKRFFQDVVDRDLGIQADILINFPSGNKFTFLTTMPIFGDSPLWNTFKYRGESEEKFIRNIVERFEEKLRRTHNYR
jgi:hypothetical protein